MWRSRVKAEVGKPKSHELGSLDQLGGASLYDSDNSTALTEQGEVLLYDYLNE